MGRLASRRKVGKPKSFVDRLMGQSADLVIAPGCIVKSWCEAGNPTVRVERGYGTGLFADLYPWVDGRLYTRPFGKGDEASAWAGSAKLLVEIPYNQAAIDLSSSSHPTKLSDDKRVILDVSTNNAPFFAGYSTGSQDASQHATQRGYSLAQTLQKNAAPYTLIAAHQHAAGETAYLIQDTGGTQLYQADAANKRHYDWTTNVSNYATTTTPNVLQQWGVNDARGIATEVSKRSGVGGVFWGDASIPTNTGTVYNLRVMGSTNSLQGKLFALIIATSALSPASMLFDGIPSSLSALFTNAVPTDKPSVVFPYNSAVVAMDLNTQTADIPVKLHGKPLKAYEASWQGAAYSTIGTTDIYGVLSGRLSGQAKGNGTLNVREVGGSTPVAITNVAVGFVWYVLGESDPDGRNDNVTHTIPSGSLRKDRINWTANSNEWWKLLAQKIYDTYGCVISVVKSTGGSTLFLNGATEGHWSLTNTSSAPALAARASNNAVAMQADFITPNLVTIELGKNDASVNTSASAFTTRLDAFLAALRSRTTNSALKITLFGIGNNTGVTAAKTDTIRLATIAKVNGTDYLMGGSLAHLPTTEAGGVHFQTQAEKQAGADAAYRNIFGSGGRAPRYLSISAPTTTTIEITLQGGVSPMTISSSSDVTGWAVSDGGGSNAVTAVNVSGLVVTLTLTRARSGTSTVKWASAATSIGTTLLDSDGTTPLPPEPFETTV